MKVKSARQRDDFSHPRVHFTARSRGLLSDLLELVYTGSKTYLAFSCETLTTLRHSNHAPRIISSSLSCDSESQLTSRRKKAASTATTERRIYNNESRSTRRLSIAIIVSIKQPGLPIYSRNDLVPKGKDTRFTHPFTLFSSLPSTNRFDVLNRGNNVGSAFGNKPCDKNKFFLQLKLPRSKKTRNLGKILK